MRAHFESESVDLIATHPPYAGIIPYSHNRIEGDLSSVHNIAEFAEEMRKVAQECMRVLKHGKHCAILIGDTRRSKHFVPITPRVLMSFLEAGFILREDIIKLQWKMKSTREKWFGKKYDFYLIGHEHLYVFRKPEVGERVARLSGGSVNTEPNLRHSSSINGAALRAGCCMVLLKT